MKTLSPGLSDSIASVLDDAQPCPHCDSSSHIAGGLCVGCLLEAGLDPADDVESETLTDILSEVRLPDQNWRLGNYEILEEIGRGGMGVIYRARQRHSRRIVAVKRVLSYHADSRETLARFRREAQAAASLDHPNILPIFEVSESEDGLPFFSMKFAPGGTLQQVAPALRNESRQCVALVAKIARAVQYAHSRGILHRDLKPGNILLDGRGEPLVSDFGLAKWLDITSDLTRTLTIFGTPGYIAPEQANSEAANLKPAADVYSLGAILFDLLAGRPPFLGAHALSVIRQAAESPAPKLRTLSKLADRDLETICSRCLERDPKLRYPSAHDLAEDLERWLEGRPIIARPVLPPIRVWRWSHRNPKLAGTIAACMLLAGIGIFWQIQSRRLANEVRKEELAIHSVVVLPFLNLNDGTVENGLNERVADALQKQASSLGLSSIRPAVRQSRKWTGIGGQDEIHETAAEFHANAALAGSIRRIGNRTRFSIRLIKENGSDLMGYWIINVDEGQEIENALRSSETGRKIYRLLGGVVDAASGAEEPDEAMRNETARSYMNAGRGLLDRRTIADMDRAIACFQGAITVTPRSVEAHSYLALAYMGRNILTANPLLTKRAFEAANEAIRLAPNDSSAHRSLSALFISTGQYAEALEHGFRSLEAAHPSERAFGQIAYTLKMLGRPDRAIFWYRKAKVTERQPADYDALIGDCWAELEADEAAQQAYETAERFRPDLPEGWLGLCHLRLIEGDYDGARVLYGERAEEYGHFHAAKQMEAEIEFFSRDFAKAEQLYAALQARDTNGDGAQQYGIVSYRSALARLKREHHDKFSSASIKDNLSSDLAALSKSPKHPEVLYRLAAAEATAGDADSSLRHLREAIDAGWTDCRSPRLDPRFDSLSSHPDFQSALAGLRRRVAELRRQLPAEQTGQTTNGE